MPELAERLAAQGGGTGRPCNGSAHAAARGFGYETHPPGTRGPWGRRGTGLRDKILKLLMQNPHGYVSGRRMGKPVGVSCGGQPTWKAQSQGREIDCKRNGRLPGVAGVDSLLPELVRSIA